MSKKFYFLSVILFNVLLCSVTGVRAQSITITPSASYCAPVSTTLSVLSSSGTAPLTYTWAPSAGLSATTGASVIATPTVTTTYTATVTQSGGGISTATSTITVNPTAPITGTLTVCQGYATTLSNAVSGGTWNSSNTSVANVASATSGAVTGYSEGTATISYTTAAGCVNTAVVTVNALGPITGSLTVCAGATTTLDDIATGGTWSIAPTTIATINATTGVVTGVAAGVASVVYTMPSGCQSTATLLVNATPAAITGANAVCLGAQITLSETTASGTWSSSNPAVATVTSGSGVVTGVTASSVLISYTVPTGCYTTYPVTVNPLPVAVSGAHVVCIALSTTLTDASTPGTWSSSNSSIASIGAGTGVVTGVSAGFVTITYKLTTTGCQIFDTVSVSTPPTAISGPTSVCAGSTVALSDGVGGGTWAGSPSTFATVNATTGAVTGVAGGEYTVSYTTQACLPVSYSLSVNPQPATITGVASVCAGYTTTLSDITPAGTWSVSGSSATISSAGVVTGISYGTLSTATYTLPTGCYRTQAIHVDSLPAPITGIDSVCQGFSVTLSNTAPAGVWSSSDGTIASAVASTGVVTGLAHGSATITYSLITGCYTTVPFSVIAPAPASVSITDTPNVAPICAGTPITFTAHPVNGGNPTYEWELFGAPVVPTDTGSIITIAPTHGDYVVVYMTVHNICASPIIARDSIALNIFTVTSPGVAITTASADSMTSFGQSVTFYSDVTYGGSTPVYQWYVNGGLIAGATSASYTAHIYENDTFYCEVNGNAPCVTGIGTSNPIIIYAYVSQPLGVSTASLSNSNLSLYPNPNTGSFVLSGAISTTEEATVEINDMLGHIVYTNKVRPQNGMIKSQIALDKNIAPGAYLLHVSSASDNQTFHFVVGN